MREEAQAQEAALVACWAWVKAAPRRRPGRIMVPRRRVSTWDRRFEETVAAAERSMGGADLAARLRERLPQLEAAIATRVYAISDPREVSDPAYLEGLNAALVAAIEHRLVVLEVGERRAPAVPPALIAQARLDARDGVPLDTVLRRYFAGNALFGDFLVEEAERAEMPSSDLRRLLAAQATLGDRLLAVVSDEHAHEGMRRPGSAAERRRECVKSLLAGELVDHSELEYDIDARHLGLMARGEGAAETMRELALRLDRRLLAVRREDEPVWACWLGGRDPLEVETALRALREIRPDRVLITVGEPGESLSGWRLSHRQAKAALPIAERGRNPWSDTRMSPCSPRSSATTLRSRRSAGSTSRRSRRPETAKTSASPCAPISGPVATSPLRRRRSASIAAL